MTIKFVIAGAALLVLSACASTPEPAPIVDNTPQQEAPPPVFSEPAPVKPVQQAPVVEIAPVYTGPAVGSSDQFKYIAGDDRVYFAYNQYDLNTQSRDVLRKQAEWLNQYSTSILVVGGNADERGTREYNLALGARRADSVKAYLVSQGVNPSRVTTVSYGKERPINGGSNEAAWAQNRNAHSAVLTGGSS